MLKLLSMLFHRHAWERYKSYGGKYYKKCKECGKTTELHPTRGKEKK